MNRHLEQNLGIIEKTLRWTLGSALILAVLGTATAPIWLALLATYPVFTAMMSWDPFYAAVGLRTLSRARRPVGRLAGHFTS